MFYQTSSQEVLQTEHITDKVQELFLCNKNNAKIMLVRDTILAAAEESGIDENECLLYNKPTPNTFINVIYMSKNRDTLDG